MPLGLHFFVPLLVLSAIHMPTWPACCCGPLATRSEGLAICLAFAHPQCVSFISHTISNHPHAFACPHGGTCHSFLENVQGGGVEWQCMRLPCGRTGWDPGGFADEPALPFAVKRGLCLRWMTLSFHGELGLTCAWKMASLMDRTMGFRGKRVPETRMI